MIKKDIAVITYHYTIKVNRYIKHYVRLFFLSCRNISKLFNWTFIRDKISRDIHFIVKNGLYGINFLICHCIIYRTVGKHYQKIQEIWFGKHEFKWSSIKSKEIYFGKLITKVIVKIYWMQNIIVSYQYLVRKYSALCKNDRKYLCKSVMLLYLNYCYH